MSADKAKMLAMIAMAVDARGRAYAPYSEFNVGAVAEGGSGKVYAGCNIENASYGLTVCAERIAIWKAVFEGETEIRQIVISTDSDEPDVPCGACLQVMQEFAPENGEMTIISCSGKNEYETLTLSELLPVPFKLKS